MIGPEEITRDDVYNLKLASVALGDGPMLDTCNLALAGDATSWRECERVIRNARAKAKLKRGKCHHCGREVALKENRRAR